MGVARSKAHRLTGIATAFFLDVRDFPKALDERERDLAERAARTLRWAIEELKPEVIGLVQTIGAELFLLLPEPVGFTSGGLGPEGSLARQRSLTNLADRIADEMLRGRIAVDLEEQTPLTERREGPLPQLPPLPPPKAERGETFFDVRFVDEVGQAISGLSVEYALGSEFRDVTTNAAGVALLEGVAASSATVTVPDLEELEAILDPRWEKLRTGTLPAASNSFDVLFRGAQIPAISVKAALPQRVVIKPALGRLFVELFDRTGRFRHVEVDYQIAGPQAFLGTTDEDGKLLHDDVLPGDYTLSFKLEVDLGEGPIVQELQTQLVVLPAATSIPEVRFLGAVPRVTLARLKGMFFDTDKSFLLPASTAAFERLREIYTDNDPSELVVVGHCDTTGDASINDPLSLERADNTAAYLRDDVDTWLAMYDQGVPLKRRWSDAEDDAMLFSTADFATKPPDEDPLRWFQRTRGLKIDGIAGPETRRQLITEYMALDGVSLTDAESKFEIEITTHGCGENFPLDEGGDELDTTPADGAEDQLDRRVELFFFDKEFGIVPKPPGKNSAKGSTAYPEWRKRAEQTAELETTTADTIRVRLHDGDSKPLPGAPCLVRVGDTLIAAKTADEEGFVSVTLPPICPVRVELSYGPKGSQEPFPFFCDLVADCDVGSDDARDRQRLHNLGYSLDWDFDTQTLRFQADYQVDNQPEPVGLVGGALPPASRELLASIFEGDCDASPPS